jgi:pimeloyl-ACP methyl ester carboxylesterase
MAEQFCRVGEIELCYESFGDPADPAMLLIMGLGTQMVAWREELCEQLAGHGFRVVRFDNRDIGRSSRIDAPPPRLRHLLLRSRRAGAYTIDDMADDAAGLLDCLDVERAHVVGASMGGMIAQMVAARHPQRTLSLCSIMSNTGSRFAGQPHLALYPVLLRQAPRERDAFVDHVERTFRAIGSPGFRRDIEDIRETAARSYDRGHDPAGGARQLGAIVASGDRTKALRRIAAPTVVIHGTKDRLVSPSGARATAKAIPGARLVMVEGMGHDLPREAWPQIVEAIVENARRADAADGAARAA